MQNGIKAVMPTFWEPGVVGLIVFVTVFVLFLWWKKTVFVRDIYQKDSFEEAQHQVGITEKDSI